MATPLTVVPTGPAGITGQLSLTAEAIENFTLPASTSELEIPLPVGLATATFVAVVNTGDGDLSFQLSTAAGATVIDVPVGAVALAYGATALYLNSTAGGRCQVIFG